MPVGKIHLECSPGVMENRNYTFKEKGLLPYLHRLQFDLSYFFKLPTLSHINHSREKVYSVDRQKPLWRSRVLI